MSLPALVKDRLIKREGLDTDIKKSNEYRVREYVKDFFKDLEEILWIFDMLPEKQHKNLFRDEDAHRLLEIAERALVNLEFMPLRRLNNGEQVVEKSLAARSRDSKVSRMFSTSGQAEDRDLQRFITLKARLFNFEKFTSPGPRQIYNALDKSYYKDIIKMAKREGFDPIESKTTAKFFIPKWTEDEMLFRETEKSLQRWGIYVDSPEELIAIKDWLEEQKNLKQKDISGDGDKS